PAMYIPDRSAFRSDEAAVGRIRCGGVGRRSRGGRRLRRDSLDGRVGLRVRVDDLLQSVDRRLRVTLRDQALDVLERLDQVGLRLGDLRHQVGHGCHSGYYLSFDSCEALEVPEHPLYFWLHATT